MMKQNIVIKFSFLSVITCLFTISLSAQDPNRDLLITDYNTDKDYFVSVGIENGTEVTFKYGRSQYIERHLKIHDVYLDSLFCVVIYDDDRYFMLSAAYLDKSTNLWTIDYPYHKWLKNNTTGSICSIKYHDVKIKDGSNVLLTYSVYGPPTFVLKKYKTTEFPITQQLLIAKDGIYDLQLNFRCATPRETEISPASPRPEYNKER